jgi:hypothetical protein
MSLGTCVCLCVFVCVNVNGCVSQEEKKRTSLNAEEQAAIVATPPFQEVISHRHHSRGAGFVRMSYIVGLYVVVILGVCVCRGIAGVYKLAHASWQCACMYM